MTGMTITPGAGDYLVSFSGSLANSSNNSEIDIAVYVNGVQAAASVRRYDNLASGDTIPSSIAAYKVTGVLDAQAIEIRWRTSAGTASVWQRNMTVQETS
jgi:hypothetical protein